MAVPPFKPAGAELVDRGQLFQVEQAFPGPEGGFWILHPERIHQWKDDRGIPFLDRAELANGQRAEHPHPGGLAGDIPAAAENIPQPGRLVVNPIGAEGIDRRLGLQAFQAVPGPPGQDRIGILAGMDERFDGLGGTAGKDFQLTEKQEAVGPDVRRPAGRLFGFCQEARQHRAAPFEPDRPDGIPAGGIRDPADGLDTGLLDLVFWMGAGRLGKDLGRIRVSSLQSLDQRSSCLAANPSADPGQAGIEPPVQGRDPF